ncbi:MAG: hypothetical protein HKN91_00525 [Acidimicrobiia bacterium]|nr:hypothetical protein [Acidimicrobiia bacterium]
MAAWLLDSDPAIRWQVERDLLDLPAAEWKATRDLVATEGWGRRTLDLQDAAGTWGGGLYTPKWTSTNYTLLLLRRFGLDQSSQQGRIGAQHLLDGADWHEGGVSYWKTHRFAERCVNGMVLSTCSYFGVDDPRVASIAEMLLRVPTDDGGWNCDDYRGATHSSFHTTISVLEALLEWKRVTGSNDADDAMAAGQEVLLAHEMYKSHRTGEVINEAWLKPTFPPRWHYDVLRGLDHLREAGTKPDGRAADAIAGLLNLRRADGRWPKGGQYTGLTHFTMEPGRVPGRWNTLRALRVLRWWGA